MEQLGNELIKHENIGFNGSIDIEALHKGAEIKLLDFDQIQEHDMDCGRSVFLLNIMEDGFINCLRSTNIFKGNSLPQIITDIQETILAYNLTSFYDIVRNKNVEKHLSTIEVGLRGGGIDLMDWDLLYIGNRAEVNEIVKTQLDTIKSGEIGGNLLVFKISNDKFIIYINLHNEPESANTKIDDTKEYLVHNLSGNFH